jgi:outer membrane protein OmpA-like peptidoglycan-associated protein
MRMICSENTPKRVKGSIFRTTVEVTAGRTASLEAYLTEQGAKTGRLYVTTEPSGAMVRILNIVPKFHQGMALSPGAYQVEVSAPGYGKQTRRVSLAAGEDNRIGFRLTGAIRELDSKQPHLSKLNQGLQTQSGEQHSQISNLKAYSREQEPQQQTQAVLRAFDEQYTAIQNIFRSDEASIYKQGNKLVIRLRGIELPEGEGTLRPDNYILLSKVQKVIKTFGQPFVTIEGHTDSFESSGKTQTMKELSLRRADVVKAYLVSNDTLPAGRIRVTGYGSTRPLAQHSTAKGRAINRRIDLLITPVKTQ